VIEALSALASTLAELQSVAAGVIAPGGPQDSGAVAGVGDASGTSFSATLRGALGRLDGTISSADATAKSFAAGNSDIPLSDVMVSLEQANLALQMAANVRDKVVAAYSNVMNMQV